jgi:hypothetical protein
MEVPVKSKPSIPWLAVAGVGLLAIMAVVANSSYRAYSRTFQNSLGGASFSVAILNPQPGAKFEQSAAILVEAAASGPGAVTEIQLWVDGVLTQIVSAPTSTGLLDFEAAFVLNDLDLGGHLLFVRATGAAADTKTSVFVPILIVAPGEVTLAEAQAAYQETGASVPPSTSAVGAAPVFGAPGPAGEAPEFPLPPVTPPDLPPFEDDPAQFETELLPWALPLGDWFQSLFSPPQYDPNVEPPAPPQLAHFAAASTILEYQAACNAGFRVQHPGTDEDGFTVYRADPGMANFVQHEVLAASPAGATFTYSDNGGLYGTYYYYVAAFNEGGEQASNILVWNSDSTECQDEDEAPDRVLDLASLFGEIDSPMSYCYYSLDEINWNRHPASPQAFFDSGQPGSGFLQPALPEPDEADDPNATPTPLTLILQTPETEQLILATPETEQLQEPPQAGLDDFNPGLPPPSANKLVLSNSGTPTPMKVDCWAWVEGGLTQVGTWEFDNVFAETLEGIQFETLDGQGPYQFSLNEFSDVLFQLLPYDQRVPVPQLSLGSGPEACAEHTGGNWLLAFVCADIADDLDYAMWGLGECSADLCFNPSDVIGYNIYDSLHDNGNTPAETVDDPISIYFMINDQSCDPRHIQVTTLVEYEGEILESFRSNQVFYNGNPNCGFLFGTEPRHYRITLDSVDFSVGDINDDPDVEDDAEGYGHAILSTANSSGHWWTLLEELQQTFDDEAEDNPYLWQLFPLWSCPHDNYCYPWFPEAEVGAFENSGDFELYIGEWGRVFIYLADADEGQDDTICQPGYFWFTTYDVDAAPNQTLSVTQSASHADASCEVKFHIELIE